MMLLISIVLEVSTYIITSIAACPVKTRCIISDNICLDLNYCCYSIYTESVNIYNILKTCYPIKIELPTIFVQMYYNLYYIYNIRTLSVNIKFICTSFRNRQTSFSGLLRSEYKWMLYLTTMYVYCVYPATSKKSENLSDLNKKDRNKRHSSPFINVVKGVFSVVRVTLVPVSYLSIRHPLYIATWYQESLFVGWKVYS
jgi:hypothetical protein